MTKYEIIRLARHLEVALATYKRLVERMPHNADLIEAQQDCLEMIRRVRAMKGSDEK